MCWPRNGPDFFENFTAYEYIELYLDMIIRLYREKPEMLRFSNNYKNFIYHEGIEEEPLGEHLDVLEPLRAMYHKLYEQAKWITVSAPIFQSRSFSQL